jgi:hypothetical protein
MFKQLSTISLISLYIGNCFQTDEDEAFSKQIGAELVNRGVLTITEYGSHWHWEKVPDADIKLLLDYQNDHVPDMIQIGIGDYFAQRKGTTNHEIDASKSYLGSC